MAPELARGGGASAKLPLIPLPPGQPAGTPVAPGWRLAVLDLDVLIRRAFDGALYSRLDAVALVGVCLVRSVTASPEPPQVQPPGPVRLVAHWSKKPSAASLKLAAASPSPTSDDGDGQSVLSLLDEVDGFIPRVRKEALEAVEEEEAARAAVEAARSAERAFLKAALSKAPPVSEEALGFIPAGEDDESGMMAADTGAAAQRLRKAVGRLGMANRLGTLPGTFPRRPGDPRDHATTRSGGADSASAGIYRDAVSSGGGGTVPSLLAERRSGVAAAQDLSRNLRWGIAGEVADLSGVQIGEGGARLLSFTLPKARHLSELRLSNSGLGDKGAAKFASCFRIMTTLRHVNLRSCGIGQHGGMAVAGAIDCGCIGMLSLLLGDNPLGVHAVAAIVAALPKNDSLQRVDLERTGAAFSAQPLFCDGDRVEVRASDVVHLRGGRRVERADGGGAKDASGAGGSAAVTTTLHGVRAGLGQLINLRTNGKPAVECVFAQCGTNAAIESLAACLSQPLPSLKVLYLGGNSFGGPARRTLHEAHAAGPNAVSLQLKLGAVANPAEAVATALAEMAATAEAAQTAAKQAERADEAIAIASAAKLWRPSSVRSGLAAPEPSLCSVATEEEQDDDDGAEGEVDGIEDDDAELQPEALHRMEQPELNPLERSQTMSKMQSASFALTGGSVASQAKPPTGTREGV